MIDLHSHILPGVDDGARTMLDSLEIAQAACADGVEAVAATPHVRRDYLTSAETMMRLVGVLREELRRRGIPLRVLPGGEVAVEQLRALSIEQLRRFGLGGNPRYLLVEFPHRDWPILLRQEIARLRVEGVTVVLAHPERNPEVQQAPEILEPLVAAGALVQLTAASLDGRFGKRTSDAARRLIKLGLAHLIASDAHAHEVRQVGLRKACEAVGDAELASWLSMGVPRAIVENSAIPPRPQGAREQAWRRALRRHR
ncbi:MAG: tyrosine-protein phosphatase [Gaiellaceae bacterium]